VSPPLRNLLPRAAIRGRPPWGNDQGHRRLLLRVGLSLGAIVLAGIAVATGFRLAYANEALPGTELGGVAVGGASETEIARRVAATARSRAPLVVVDGDQWVAIGRDQVDYEVDVSASADRALDAGRTGVLGGLPSTLAGVLGGHHVPLVATLNPAKLRRVVASVAEAFDRPSFAGRLDISPATLQVDVVPPRAGLRVARRLLATRLEAALLEGAAPRINLPLESPPVVTDAEVEQVAEWATEYLQRPLLLVDNGTRIAISVGDLARILALKQVSGGNDVQLGIDRQALDGLVERVAGARGWPARDARPIAPALPVVLDGKEELSWQPRAVEIDVKPSRLARLIDKSELARSIEEAVQSGAHEAGVAVRRVEPAISTDDVRGIDFLIGTFTTYYEAGEPRVRNIRQMAAAVDGTIVLPGEQFSLNGAVGRRTRAKGYVPAPFIADGKIVQSIGGGVSQFSTTMYNAVYFAGLAIDAYQPHSLFIDRYPAGREATLNYPDIDLRWTNDTETPVLVRATSGPTSVSVSLYGDNGGRQVRAATGSRETVPGGDFMIEVTRIIRFADGRTDRHSHTTRYELAG